MLFNSKLPRLLELTKFPHRCYIKIILAYVIDLQNTVQKSFICLICAVQIHKSIQFWKQNLRTNGFMSSLLYEILWNVQKSLPYFMPIGNKFLPQFHRPKIMKTQNSTKVRWTVIMKALCRKDNLSTTCQCRQLSANPNQCKLTSIVYWPIQCRRCWYNTLRKCKSQWCWYSPSIFLAPLPLEL